MLTSEEMRTSLRAFAKAVPIRKELQPPIMSAIEVLRESDVQALLWRLGRPTTRWRLLCLLTPSIGADRAFVALAQLPEVEAPTGRRMVQKGQWKKHR